MPGEERALQQFADIVAEKIVDAKRAEELRKIVADHQVWLQTGGEDGRKADLRGFNLERLNLSNLNLRGADLRGARLAGARLDGADLWQGDLRGANLTDARLLGARLEGANLDGADLHRASLREAVAYGTRFTDVRMSHADFSNADLGAADFSGADGRAAGFDGARMYGIRAVGTDFSEALFQQSGGQRTDLRHADLRSAVLEDASMRGTNLGQADLTNARMARANAAGANLHHANLENTDMRKVRARGCRSARAAGAGPDRRGPARVQPGWQPARRGEDGGGEARRGQPGRREAAAIGGAGRAGQDAARAGALAARRGRTHRPNRGRGPVGSLDAVERTLPLDRLLAGHPSANLLVAAERVSVRIADCDLSQALAQRCVPPRVKHPGGGAEGGQVVAMELARRVLLAVDQDPVADQGQALVGIEFRIQQGRVLEQPRVGVFEVLFPVCAVASEHRVSCEGSDVPGRTWVTSLARPRWQRPHRGGFGGSRGLPVLREGLILHSSRGSRACPKSALEVARSIWPFCHDQPLSPRNRAQTWWICERPSLLWVSHEREFD